MNTLFTVLVLLSALVLIVSVLLQSGKTSGMSGAFGGGAEQIWGKNKAKDYDAKFEMLTKISAVVFMISSLMLVYFTKG